MRKHWDDGQVLVVVLVIMLVISTLVPVMILFTQREAVWTNKQARSTTAFHLAEAGVEKGYLELSISTQNWVSVVQKGQTLTDYHFDKRYEDLSGGHYAISITSGPTANEATVISIGQDSLNRETRAIKAIYSNSTAGNIAIMGGNGVDVSGNNLTVEWGAIVSPNTIVPNGANHPSYWSASSITGYDTDPTPPNCDSPNCWWWHSYYAGIPPMPTVDFNFYKSSAQASGTAPSPCSQAYYQSASMSGTCKSTNGKPFYVEGTWTSFDGPVIGAVIVMGDMTTPNGAMSGSNINAPVPQQAWKQYCNDWSYYRTTYEPTNPYTTACPGLSSSYLSSSSLTYAISPVVQGLLYIGGNFTGPQGGGNTDLAYGVLIVKGTVSLNSNSHVKYYYSDSAAQNLQTTQIILARQLWQDYVTKWPTGL